MSDKDLVKAGQTGIASIMGDVDMSKRPDFIPEGDKSGTENIDRDDIQLPRIAIAQGLSPEVLPGQDRIAGLEIGQLFNTGTKQKYGNGPIYFIAVRRDKRCIHFRPRKDGGGIIDMNVPWNDDRATVWGEPDATGKKSPPVATRFNEWVVLILQNPQGDTESAVISIKMTNKWNRRAASDLNGYIGMHAAQEAKSVPIYGVIYAMTTEMRLHPATGSQYGTPVFRQIGFIPQTDVGKVLYERAKGYAALLKKADIIVEREPGDETDFSEAEFTEEKQPAGM